jgi:hypothetical protein
MSRGLQWLNVIACCVLGAAIACWTAVEIWPHVRLVSTVRAQGNIRTIIVDPPYRNDALEIAKVIGAGEEAVAGAPSADDLRGWPSGGYLPGYRFRVAYRLAADDSWLETLSFVLRNRTSEKVALVEIWVQLPQDRTRAPSIFSFGQLPASDAYFGDGKPIPPSGEPIVFKPCEEMTFRLAGGQFGPAHVKAIPVSETSQVYVRFQAYLEDGLVWGITGWGRPDPEHPGQWVPTPGPYFPPNGLPGPAMKRPKHYQSPCELSTSSKTEGELTP